MEDWGRVASIRRGVEEGDCHAATVFTASPVHGCERTRLENPQENLVN